MHFSGGPDRRPWGISDAAGPVAAATLVWHAILCRRCFISAGTEDVGQGAAAKGCIRAEQIRNLIALPVNDAKARADRCGRLSGRWGLYPSRLRSRRSCRTSDAGLGAAGRAYAGRIVRNILSLCHDEYRTFLSDRHGRTGPDRAVRSAALRLEPSRNQQELELNAEKRTMRRPSRQRRHSLIVLGAMGPA
eukprot:759817-Hanusia_phi.AAC.2